MITPEGRKGTLKDLVQICRSASADTSLSDIREKFQDLDLSAYSIPGEILRTSVERDLQQILSSQSLERAKHYIKRLQENLSDPDNSEENGLNVKLWKGYDHIITDSLWKLGRRVSNDTHKAWYWGNFVPQIPFQLISRYTAPGDWVLDPFLGSGTTAMEAVKLNRNTLGIELNGEVYDRVKQNCTILLENSGARIELYRGNSLEFDYTGFAKKNIPDGIKLAILHPPYWDIIQFSKDKEDLSNAVSIEDFTEKLRLLVSAIMPAMAKKGHLGLVIGDMYRNGEVIPLGFRSMDALQSMGLSLRGIIVKDIQNTRAKRSSENLWRYRALKSGFYVFKHEYVFVFRLP